MFVERKKKLKIDTSFLRKMLITSIKTGCIACFFVMDNIFSICYILCTNSDPMSAYMYATSNKQLVIFITTSFWIVFALGKEVREHYLFVLPLLDVCGNEQHCLNLLFTDLRKSAVSK